MPKKKKQIYRPKKSQTQQENGLDLATTESSMSEEKQPENKSNNGSLLIEKLLWKIFVDVAVTDNYALVGGADKWEEILCEYADNIRSEKSNNLFDCWRKIKFIEFKIQFVQTALEVLNDFYSEKIALALCELGFDFIDNDPDTAAYRKKLQMMETEAKVLIVLLNQHNTEYMALSGKNGNVKRTRMDFEKEMAILRRAGFKIKKSTTTFEMCAIINTFIDQPKNG